MRYALLILFLLVLALPFVMRISIQGSIAQSQPTRSADQRLVIVTPHNQDILRAFRDGFNEWHQRRFGQSVEIDYRVPGGTNDIKRLLDNIYRGYRDENGRLPSEMETGLDMVWGGGDYFFDQELKPLGILQPMKLDPQLLAEAFPQPTLAGVKLLDASLDDRGRPAPQWVGVCLSSFGIVYNSDLYDSLELPYPKQWAELTNEKLFGLLAMADPAHSGSVAVAYMMVIQRAMADAEERFFESHANLKGTARAELEKHEDYRASIAAGWKTGMRTLVLIAANARYFSQQSSQVPNDVGNGQAAAGMTIDFYGRVYEESVGPRRCRYIAPAAATAITPDPVAILHGVRGKREELANRFVTYLLSPEGQRRWILKAGLPGAPANRSLRRPPIRPDVYADRSGWADDVNPFAEAGGFNQRSEWMSLFADTRMIWAAAWIDSRDVMREAYGKILEVPNANRRSALIAQFSNIPIEMHDVAEIRRQRQQAQAAGNVDEWRATTRINWARRFTDHYRKVRSSAQYTLDRLNRPRRAPR